MVRWGIIFLCVSSRGWTDISGMLLREMREIGRVPEERMMAPCRDYGSRGTRILIVLQSFCSNMISGFSSVFG